MDEALMGSIKSEQEDGITFTYLYQPDSLRNPPGDTLPEVSSEAEDSCGLKIVPIYSDMSDDMKRESQHFEILETGDEPFQIVKSELQDIEAVETETEEIEFPKPEPQVTDVIKVEPPDIDFVKTESLEVDDTEVFLPDWNDANSEKGSEILLLEEEHRFPVYSESSELKTDPVNVDKQYVSGVLEMSMDMDDYHKKPESREVGFECIVTEEDIKNDGMSHHLDLGEMFSHDLCSSESTGRRVGEDSHCDDACINKYNSIEGPQIICDNEITVQGTENDEISTIIGQNKKELYDNCQNLSFANSLRKQHLNSSEVTYKCIACERKFQDSSCKRNHVTSHTRQKQYICEHCGHVFVSSSGKAQHIQAVHLKMRQYECQHCGQKFGQHSNMKKHVQTVHLKEKQFECEQCGQRFGEKANMRIHVQTVHLKVKKFECKFCGQKFGQICHLKKHIRSIHVKEKHYECQHCGQKFGEKGSMRRHIQTVHLKVKRFECHYCGRRFAHNCDMKKHIQTFHLQGKHYECQHCMQKFQLSSDMKKHIHIVHLNGKQFECPKSPFEGETK